MSPDGSPPPVGAWVLRLDAALRAAAVPERAAGERAYLKVDLTFYGCTVWAVRRAVRAATPVRTDEEVAADAPSAARLPDQQHGRLVAGVRALWAPPVFERRLAAAQLLDGASALLGPGDLPLLEELVRASGTWALVDVLAGDVLGAVVLRDPAATRPVLDAWSRDDDFWVRRASLLAELATVRAGGSLAAFLARADPLLEEREFFVRKAIGWVLREAGKRRPGEVAAWLGPRVERTSGVTLREAVKHLDAADAAALRAEHTATPRPRGARTGRRDAPGGGSG